MIETEVTRSTYVGNGTTNEYDYDYKIYDRDHLLLTVTDLAGLETTLVIDVDFDVAGVGGVDGGSITLIDAGQDWIDDDSFLKSSYGLLIRRVMPLKQETDVRNQSEYYPEMHEDEFDKLEMQIQQVEDLARRSIHAPETEDVDDLILPTVEDRAEKLLGFDDQGKPRSYTHAEIALGETGIITTDDLPEGDDNLYYTDQRWQDAWDLKDTDDLAEGVTNFYYTASRFNTSFAAKTTTDLAEGINLYYTAARFNTAFSGKTTSDLTEGTNLYYTQARFNTAFSAKSTSDLAEGTNLYYTNARADARIAAANLNDLNDVVITSPQVDDVLAYNGANWVNSATAGGGGGGGGTIKWEEAASAPIRAVEYNVGVWLFEDAIDNYLYTAVKVPQSYSAGAPVEMRLLAYDESNTGTVLLQSLTTLVRPGTDSISSTTNQRTSTNTALNFGSNGGRPQSVILDISSSIGQVNAVAISAGDILLVRLKRDFANDTSTGAARFIEQSAEVTFS